VRKEYFPNISIGHKGIFFQYLETFICYIFLEARYFVTYSEKPISAIKILISSWPIDTFLAVSLLSALLVQS